MFKLFSNQKGVSLVEVMMAAGISSVIALGTMKINENSQHAMRKVTTDSALDNFKDVGIRNYLSGDGQCVAATFTPAVTGLAQGASMNLTQVALGTDDMVLNNTLTGQGNWELTAMSFQRATASECFLNFTVQRTNDRVMGAKTRNESVRLGCQFDATNDLIACSAASNDGMLGYWREVYDSASGDWHVQYEGNSGQTYVHLGDSGANNPSARLTVPTGGNGWNGLSDGIALSPNNVLRWGALYTADDGVAIHSDGADCINFKDGAGADHLASCSTGTTINAGLTSTGDITAQSSVTVSNNLTVGGAAGLGSLSVTGASNLSGVSASSLSVSGASNLNSVTAGNITGGSLTLSGGATVSSAIHSYGSGVFDSLFVNGSATASIYYTHSDRRFKEYIEPLENPLESILALNPVQYDLKKEYVAPGKDRKQLGLIAQEVREVYPELVNENSNGYLAVNYVGLIAPIIDSVKVLYKSIVSIGDSSASNSREIASLKKENQELRERLDRLEAALENKSSQK